MHKYHSFTLRREKKSGVYELHAIRSAMCVWLESEKKAKKILSGSMLGIHLWISLYRAANTQTLMLIINFVVVVSLRIRSMAMQAYGVNLYTQRIIAICIVL